LRDIDTGALSNVDPALGIGRPVQGATRPTVFDDETLQQVLPVENLAARGRARDLGAGNEGLFALTFKSVHTEADDIQLASINPWVAQDPATTTIRQTMPTFQGFAELDIWLLWVQMFRLLGVGGSTTFDAATLKIVGQDNFVPGFGTDGNPGSGVSFTQDGGAIAYFELLKASSSLVVGTGAGAVVLPPSGEAKVRLGIRLPRGAFLDYFCRADGDVNEQTFVMLVMCASVPRGMLCADAV
jgi:hypothetical protein